jgi:hypothetical protein
VGRGGEAVVARGRVAADAVRRREALGRPVDYARLRDELDDDGQAVFGPDSVVDAAVAAEADAFDELVGGLAGRGGRRQRGVRVRV